MRAAIDRQRVFTTISVGESPVSEGAGQLQSRKPAAAEKEKLNDGARRQAGAL